MKPRRSHNLPDDMKVRSSFRPFHAVLALSLLLGVSAIAEAKDQARFTKVSTPLFGAKKGKILGQLPPGTPVTVLKKAGKRAEIMVEGWTQEYRDLQVFAGKELPIERVTLVRIDPKRRKVISTVAGRFDVKWTKVQLTGWVDSRKLVNKLSAVWAPARELHQERCTECHDFKPASELTAQQWSGALLIMTHRAALTPEESALLKQFLQAGARERSSK